jgi:hypothetical protein
VYIDRLFAFAVIQTNLKAKRHFNHSRIVANAFDKPFGFDLGCDRRQACISQTDEESEQKPIGRTAIIVLRNGEGIFLENEFSFSKTLCIIVIKIEFKGFRI